MPHPGYTELINHIRERGVYASLSNFTTIHKNFIPGWPLEIKATSTNGLYRGWCNRFANAYKYVHDEMPPKPKRFKKHVWDKIFDDFMVLKADPTPVEEVEVQEEDDTNSDSSPPPLPPV
ncbi:unnamed protein product [Mucor hiemalis]